MCPTFTLNFPPCETTNCGSPPSHDDDEEKEDEEDREQEKEEEEQKEEAAWTPGHGQTGLKDKLRPPGHLNTERMTQ